MDPAIDDGPPIQEGVVESLESPVADVPKPSDPELRGDDEAKQPKLPSTFQEGPRAFQRDSGVGFTGSEKAIHESSSTPTDVDPTTNFWTVYKTVADEHDGAMLKKYGEDMDTSLIFAGLFSAVVTTFIAQILPSPQSITSGSTSASSNVVKARSILFASLAVTLLAAFITVLGKQWVLRYTRASTWGNIVDRGMERQRKFVGLQKWGLRYIMGSVPVLLQLALLLFNGGLIVYLWDLDRSSADVMLAVTCTGFAFYTVITAIATICDDGSPFQTTLSALLLSAWPLVKKVTIHARTRPKRPAAPPPRTEPAEEHAHPTAPTRHLPSSNGGAAASIHDDDYMKLSNPAFWRPKPLFDPLPMDTSASAGFWLIENSTDFSAAAAVATVFYEFQWPSHHHSPTALIRLRDTYVGRFRAHRANKLARLQALQCAAAYYVLYHAWLIWIKAKGREAEVEKLLPTLPPDLLLLHNNSEEWRGRDLFEYLLRIENRSEPVESPHFLSYIAPYWFCGDSDSAIRFRSGRLETLTELIAVLKSFKALVPATLTDCVLCVGAAMDFPLHPDDLIRVDKSDCLAPTFKLVVEHVLGTALAGSRRFRHVAEALKILLALVKLTTLPLVNATWIYELLKRAASSNISDEEFTLILKLSAWRKEEGAAVNTGAGDPPVQHFEADPQSLERTATSEDPASDDTLFRKVMKAIQTCGRQDEIVYGGLLAIRDVRKLGPSLFDDKILQTFHEATDDSNPFRIRQAAYDAVLVTQAQWLKSENLRQKLQDLGFFSQLHSVAADVARSDYQGSFLTMMGILSEDVNWHPYLREHMELWVPFRYDGGPQILHILGNIGGLTLATPGDRGSTSLDDFLQRLVVEEWAAVPGRPVGDLTADRLKQLADVTAGFKELAFSDRCRKAVLATVEKVLPGLEPRREGGYPGPGDDVREIINDLLEILRVPKRQFTSD